MKKIRPANRNCFTCGTQIPKDVIDVCDVDDVFDYRCPDCNDMILRGTIGRDTSTPTIPFDIPPFALKASVYYDTDWSVWEEYWTTESAVSALHGCVVRGSKDLYKFASKIHDF